MWGRVIFEGCGFRALLMMTSGDSEQSRGLWDEIDAALMRDLRAMRWNRHRCHVGSFLTEIWSCDCQRWALVVRSLAMDGRAWRERKCPECPFVAIYPPCHLGAHRSRSALDLISKRESSTLSACSSDA